MSCCKVTFDPSPPLRRVPGLEESINPRRAQVDQEKDEYWRKLASSSSIFCFSYAGFSFSPRTSTYLCQVILLYTSKFGQLQDFDVRCDALRGVSDGTSCSDEILGILGHCRTFSGSLYSPSPQLGRADPLSRSGKNRIQDRLYLAPEMQR